MTTLLEQLRLILGEPDFYITNGSYSGSWDYGAMIEYIGGLVILTIVVSGIFRFACKAVER